MATISVERIAERCEGEFERLRAARPALSSRIGRAENILVTHLSCPEAGIVRPRIRGGELVGYLVKGSGGAVYWVESGTFSCSCPDHHRRGKGCKHGIACYALGRVFRPSGAPASRHDGPMYRRCDTGSTPKITRHDVAGEATASEKAESPTGGSYGERTCSRCLDGLTYDEQRGEWVACERCEGTGRVLAFLYEHAERHLSECVGWVRPRPLALAAHARREDPGAARRPLPANLLLTAPKLGATHRERRSK